MVDGEDFIVTQAVKFGGGKESSLMDRGAVIYDLKDGLVLVCDCGIEDVDQAVSTTRKEP